MAKAKKNDHVVSDIPADEPSSGVQNEAPALTNDQLKAMFDAYFEADANVSAAEQHVESLKTARSEAVKALVDALGNKGPWSVGGIRLCVTVRGEKYHMTKESDARLTL